MIDDIVLATSGLVTDSIKHSDSKVGDFIGLTLSATMEIVYVEVNDPGSIFSGPHVRKEADAEDGRGLLIVGEISLEWGTREHGRSLGRTVWCTSDSTRAGATNAHPANSSSGNRIAASSFGVSAPPSYMMITQRRYHSPLSRDMSGG
ncbi:ATP-binding protein [Streptosporangium amethystogenes]|uniref:ATP-binding protein n=1 Tax=Streptosporangium amethystogenes TaxID=2002 RepID=UPI0012F7B9FA|nr:ATP-binding protein [Streptosporangium amethystogenes]